MMLLSPVRDAAYLAFGVIALALIFGAAAALTEEDRLIEYHKRNYTWPIQNYIPNTEGWRNLMESRFRQVEEIEDRGQTL